MSVYVQDSDFTLWHGDALDVLAGMPDASVHCCVTSPPYWGLRDYGHEGQLGLEATPDEYVARMVEVLREVRRVLHGDGTLWLNLGDSYVSVPGGQHQGENGQMADRSVVKARAQVKDSNATRALPGAAQARPFSVAGIAPKNLVGIPWRVAFALQADGWYLRSDIIWSKPNPMPESVTDRPTKSHEYVFLLTKSARYFYAADTIAEPAEWARWGAQTVGAGSNPNGWIKPKGKNELTPDRRRAGFNERWDRAEANGVAKDTRNARTVWEIATQPYPEAHFATYPLELVRRCILAGCPEGGTVLDPFMGSGTTALVARKHGRHSIGIELNADYCELAARRLSQLSLLAGDAA